MINGLGWWPTVSGRPVVCFWYFPFPSESHKHFCFGKVVTILRNCQNNNTWSFQECYVIYKQWWLCCSVLQQSALIAWACQSNPNKTKKSYNCMKVILYGSIIYGHVAVNCDPGRKIASLLLVWPNLKHWEDLIPFSYILGIWVWFWFHTVLDTLDSNFCWDLSNETKIDYIKKDLILHIFLNHVCLQMHRPACLSPNMYFLFTNFEHLELEKDLDGWEIVKSNVSTNWPPLKGDIIPLFA